MDNPLALVDIKKIRNTRKWLVFTFVKFIEYQVSSDRCFTNAEEKYSEMNFA